LRRRSAHGINQWASTQLKQANKLQKAVEDNKSNRIRYICKKLAASSMLKSNKGKGPTAVGYGRKLATVECIAGKRNE